ncbi:hypothetical protein JCGZ_17492 [Jatropha curcas]|uniref:Uncharacterized protein n=1 Tax=Jatropha curcas TaxID=180498 RepID=A0A067KDM1_JATCU|nr:hypothetical protein JCGZ_17492 [Jatropha curcas]
MSICSRRRIKGRSTSTGLTGQPHHMHSKLCNLSLLISKLSPYIISIVLVSVLGLWILPSLLPALPYLLKHALLLLTASSHPIVGDCAAGGVCTGPETGVEEEGAEGYDGGSTGC